jgi:hypothetical protein
MELSNLLIKIIVLILPGIISWMLFRKLVGWSTKPKWYDFCEIIVFSVITYSVYGILVKILKYVGLIDYNIVFFETVLSEETKIVWWEIFWASLIGVPIAFLSSYVSTHKLINKLGRHLDVTRKFGDEDVWDFFHNLPEAPGYDWVYVRDYKANLVYFGCIVAYSDSEKERELLLVDVDVFTNGGGEWLYKTKMLYLCRDKYDLLIEVPAIDEKKQNEISKQN